VTCVIGHGDGDLGKLTSLGCTLSSSTSLIKYWFHLDGGALINRKFTLTGKVVP
jgi:hypothetical protein